ncbi:MAG: UDP-N-acetylglucosamine 2-epimerase (non-hydrolyzing) [Candidatus Nanopelagicales bacterium]
MKIVTVVGTRPEIIRLAAVMRRLDSTDGVEHVLVHTGQNYDYSLNEVFFDELGLRKPDHFLEVATDSLGATIGEIISKTEVVLDQEQPDAFLVLGDTNSALSTIIAKRKRIPTYHMEAGNRCFDLNVPEETNRKLVDHTADYNLAYTEHARRNLLAEGLHPRKTIVTGSPMKEVLGLYRDQINGSLVLDQLELKPREFFLVSAHREETVDNQARLEQLLVALNEVADKWGRPVLVSTHPRTRKRIEALPGKTVSELVRFHEPFGLLEYCKLQLSAACVLSDSGTIAEESAILGFPAVTLRGSIERPEALDTGSITMVDIDPESVISGVEFAMNRVGNPELPADYAITNTSERVVNYILSTVPQHKQWHGLR